LELIEQAKQAYQRQKAPAAPVDGSIVVDPNDPRFDLETYLTHVSKQ
jgi:hypothetical protein